MAARKVIFAQLQGPFQAPGLDGLSTLQKTLSTKLQRDIQMWYTDTDLEVQWKGFHFSIPKPNVVGVIFEKVEVATPEKTEGTLTIPGPNSTTTVKLTGKNESKGT